MKVSTSADILFHTFCNSAVHLTGNYVPDQEEADDEMEIPPELAALAARMRAAEQVDDMEWVGLIWYLTIVMRIIDLNSKISHEDTGEADANPLSEYVLDRIM